MWRMMSWKIIRETKIKLGRHIQLLVLLFRRACSRFKVISSATKLYSYTKIFSKHRFNTYYRNYVVRKSHSLWERFNYSKDTRLYEVIWEKGPPFVHLLYAHLHIVYEVCEMSLAFSEKNWNEKSFLGLTSPLV